MKNDKFVAVHATMDMIDYAFPCFHNNQYWNGWAMPYFRFKHAKLVAKEFKGKYDPERDAFIFDDQGDEDVYVAQFIKVKGKTIKVYPIGAGSWCWDLADDIKLFSGYWGNDFYEPGTRITTEGFYCEEVSYEKSDIDKIQALNVGEVWKSPDYGSAHTVTRIQ